MDPQTGVFHTTPTAIADTSTPPIAGTVEVTININLKTKVPTGGQVGCEVTLHASQTETTTPYTTTEYDEQSYAAATISGSTATCIAKIPYAWHFPASTGTESNLTGAYVVEMIPAANVEPPIVRETSSDFLSTTTIPATGTTSTYTIPVTL
jgi:hypothetical protein